MHTGRRSNRLVQDISLAGALLIIGALSLWPGLYGWFVFDDHVNLVAAENWKVTSLDWRTWQRALASDISGAVGRPLAMGSFAVNYYLSGLDPFWLKAGNLGIHLLNSVLIWRLCRRILILSLGNQSLAMHASWLVALAWTVHPLQVSTVMYVVQRMEIGATTGILLALLAYVTGRSRQICGRAGWPWLITAPLAVLLGLGFKETALLTPGFAVLLELTVLRFRSEDRATSHRLKITWCGLAALGLALYLYVVLPQVRHWPYDLREFGPAERMLTQLPVLVMYIQQLLLPFPESMRFYYDTHPVSRGLLQPLWTAISAGILLTLAIVGAVSLKRLPLVTLGIGWFFIGHALTSNLWPLELAFEHRNYLATFGLLIALVQPVDYLLRRFSPQAKAVMLIMPTFLLIALCNLQARTWGNPMQLALTLENRAPDSPRASYDLASQFLVAANDDPDSPFWSMALKQFERGALAASPSPLALQGLLMMHGRAGIEPADQYWELLYDSFAARGTHGERAGVLHALTACQIQGRCSFNTGRMLDIFITVIQQNPRNPTAHTLYANFAWNVLHDPTLAIRHQREAMRLEPSNKAYRVALAKFLLASGDEADRAEGRTLLRQLHSSNRTGQLDRDLAELEELVRRVGHPNSETH